MRIKFLIALVAFALATESARRTNAAIILGGETSSEVQLINNHLVFTLTFTSNVPGAQIGGLVGNLPGNVAFQATSGTIGQSTFPVATPTQDLNAAITDEATDSQFLITISQIQSAVAPFETATTLGGAFALNSASRGTTKALVQLSIPNVQGYAGHYDFGISEALGDTSTTFNFSGQWSIDPIAEPSSALLGGIGLAALLGVARHRRQIV